MDSQADRYEFSLSHGAEPWSGTTLGLFDSSGTAHSANVLHGLARAASSASLPTIVYAPLRFHLAARLPGVDWIDTVGPAEVGTAETRAEHRAVLNTTLGAFRPGPNRIFCDMGLDRTLASRGARVPSNENTVFVCHRTGVLDRVPLRLRRRIRRNRSKNRRNLRVLGDTGARFLVHTQAVADRLADFVDERQVVRTGWPVKAADALSLGPDWQPAAADRTILLAGSLRAEKGFQPFLEAVHGLPGYDRLIVPGRISSHLRRRMMVTDPRIELWDRWLTEAEYEDTFSRAALVALPYDQNYGERGTMSSVLLEAMSFGRPVVVSRSIRHLLPPNYAGAIVVDVTSAAAIAAGLSDALDVLPALERAAMAEGRRFIAEHHTYEQYLLGILETGGAIEGCCA